MDFNLRCNSLKCRVSLNDRAVVTTCSHIFCVACADSLSLSDPRVNIRTCPACETQLSNPDDAVVTQLNPTEDYKTSVLSGLSPGLIMECASRGLAFFQYQTTQEIMYQDYMAKSLTDKYAALSAQMDSVINEANAEITSLRDSLSSLHIDKKNLQRKNQELANAFREKSRAQERLQGLYQKLKSQQSAHLIQHAAADDVDTVIHSINGADFVDDLHVGSLPQRTSVAQAKIYNLPPVYDHARAGSSGSGGSKKGQSSIRHNVANTGGVPQNRGIAEMPMQRMKPPPLATYAGRATGLVFDDGFGTTVGRLHQMTPNRQSLGTLDHNTSGYQDIRNYRSGGSAEAVRGHSGHFSRQM